jgi:hypothetical protein
MPNRGRQPTHRNSGGRLSTRPLLRTRSLSVPVASVDIAGRHAGDPCCALFLTGIQVRDLRHVEQRVFPRSQSDLGELERVGEVELSWRGAERHDAVISLGGGMVALVSADSSMAEVSVAGQRAGSTRRACARLELLLRDDDQDSTVAPRQARVRSSVAMQRLS